MPPDWFNDVRPLVRDGVQECIGHLQIKEFDQPIQEFHRLNSDGVFQTTTKFEKPCPGLVVDDKDVFDTLYLGEFKEAAQAIYDYLPSPPVDDAYSETRRIESIERALFEFAGIVMNYIGDMKYDDAAFEAAFSDQFEPRFTDREESRFILCLKNTHIYPDISIDLNTDINGSPDYMGPYGVETLRIRPLDELEEIGIATYEEPYTTQLESVGCLHASQPNPAVEIVLRRRRPYREIALEIDNNEINPWSSPEFGITPNDGYPWQQLTEVIRYIATSVRRCLRLQTPLGNVGFEKGYYVTKGWETYRGISTPAIYGLDFDCQNSTTGTVIGEDRALEIDRLWNDHRWKLFPDDSMFDNPLSRFERMFSRESYEDQLIDCAVGLDTTLLNGGSPGGNRYRLGLRAASLIGRQNTRNWTAYRVGEFFRTLYQYRNKVVHEDKPLPSSPTADNLIRVDGKEFADDTFLAYSRELYADILLSYFELTSELDMSIKQINDHLDRLILEKVPNAWAIKNNGSNGK